MKKDLLSAQDLKKYFLDRGYNCLQPHQVVNNKDTVFLTAGIQPIVSLYRKNLLDSNKKIYISQPVIRTQFKDSTCEGTSIAFVNSTTSGFNISEMEHNILVKDFLNLFYELGMKQSDISSKTENYERLWGDLIVTGKTTFHYYKDIELGDTTFFTSIKRDGKNIGIDSMSDVGFGLERIRWCVSGKSYFDMYENSSELESEVKAYLSVLALLAVNNVLPSNKNSGYRARSFSKTLVRILHGRDFSEREEAYLIECVKYWKDWQEINKDIDLSLIKNEYIRNCNRYIIDQLAKEGYDNLSGININISREELVKRLLASSVDENIVKKMIKIRK